MDNFARDCGHQSGRFSATVADSNPIMEANAPWRQSVDSTVSDVFPQSTGRRQTSVQSFSVHQAVETEEAQDEYDLFAITRSLDWYEADEQEMPSEALLKPEEPEFTGPLSRMYLNNTEEYQSSSDTSIGPMEHMGAPSFMMSTPSASNAILPCGASPAAHLLGSRRTSGDLQFLMDTEGDHCTPTGLLDGSAIHKPASSNSIADDCRILYPATPPQNIIGKRDWMDPYHASPQESATSMFSSSHSSVDTMHLLADVPDVLDAPFAIRDMHLPYDFDRHPNHAVRYDSLHSCAGLDDLAPDEVLAGIELLCAAPATPLGMCYAPMPVHHARSRMAASPAGKPGAFPAPAAAPATSEPAESEGRQGVRQRACKRKIKYSDSEPPLSTASDGPRSLVTSARGRCSKPRRFFTAGTESDEEVSEGSNKRRKHHNPWSVEETEALVVGVERCGGGKWADIKKLGFPVIAQRSAVDLKDKWRNLMRVALLPGTAAKTKIEKRREVPQDLLDRVRMLSASFGSKASASARPYLGRPRRSL